MVFQKGNKEGGRLGYGLEKKRYAKLLKEFDDWHKILSHIKEGKFDLRLDYLKLVLDSYKAALSKLHPNTEVVEAGRNLCDLIKDEINKRQGKITD